MPRCIQIGLVGDYDPQVRAHLAIPKALAQAAEELEIQIEPAWLATDGLRDDSGALARFQGLWVVPGSPYRSMEGALRAIRHARERRIPFLGTCGGFQHAIIEYARNVLGMSDADHEESNPGASTLLVTRLSCSLTGVTGPVLLRADSRAGSIYGKTEVTEEYNCNFGFHAAFRPLLEDGGMMISGRDDRDEVRVIELPSHPFFVATLFQPELAALRGLRHPMVRAFVEAAANQ